MLRRVKNKVKRVLRPLSSANPLNAEENIQDQDFLEVLAENKILNPLDKLIPRREIVNLSWNGPVMKIEGYFYLENIPMDNEDLIRKRLILIDSKFKQTTLPLDDVLISELPFKFELIDELYKWSGFKGEFNFSTMGKNRKPIPAGSYQLFIEIEVNDMGKRVHRKTYPLGNVEKFFPQGFYSSKMEFFSARKELKYNLLVRNNKNTKTLEILSNKLKDFDPILMGMAANNQDGFLYRFANKYVFKLLYNFFKLYPLKTRKVVFASESREDLSGNFQYVYDELIRRQLGFNYKFFLQKQLGAKRTYLEMVDLAYHLATAKFVLLDDFYPLIYPLKIRKNSELVQLWHAVGAFKTFGFSRIGLPGGPSPTSKNHRNYTKAIVSSHNIAKHYAEGFGIDVENVLPTGIPRTDVFFDSEYSDRVTRDLYEEFPFMKNKKVIMFAPTFRGNGQQSAHYDMEMLKFDKLYEELHDEYIFIFKMHPFVKNDFSIPYQYNDFFYDLSYYREINDLLFITDILITDYSSVCFEFALLKKPMLFFAYDVEEYVQTRDFYYDYLSFIPGPLVKSTEQMITTIKNKAFELEKVDKFIEYFFDQTDGHSSERVVNHILLENDL